MPFCTGFGKNKRKTPPKRIFSRFGGVSLYICKQRDGLFFFFFVLFLFAEENFVYGEIQEELNCTAASTGNRNSRIFTDFVRKERNKCGRKPCREANQSDGEDDVNRQSNCNVCIGVESLVSVDEERNNLCDDVAQVCGNENAKTDFSGGFKYPE